MTAVLLGYVTMAHVWMKWVAIRVSASWDTKVYLTITLSIAKELLRKKHSQHSVLLLIFACYACLLYIQPEIHQQLL